MELRALRYFLAVVDAGSFNAAAAAISISQPALTRQIHDLEQDLDVVLLHRTSRGVRLTPSGVTLYLAAQKIVAEATRVRAALAKPRDNASEIPVVLGASPSVARVLVPGIFAACQRMSAIRCSVREAFTPTLLEWLTKGMVDIAIITRTEEPITAPVNLQPLLSEPFVLASPKRSDAPQIIHVSDLHNIPLLMTILHRHLVEAELARVGGRLRIAAEIDSVDSIREMVRSGNGSTLMPVSVFRAESDDRVSLTEIVGSQLQRQLLLATRIERNEGQGVSALSDLVVAETDRLTRNGIFSLRSPAG